MISTFTCFIIAVDEARLHCWPWVAFFGSAGAICMIYSIAFAYGCGRIIGQHDITEHLETGATVAITFFKQSGSDHGCIKIEPLNRINSGDAIYIEI